MKCNLRCTTPTNGRNDRARVRKPNNVDIIEAERKHSAQYGAWDRDSE